MSPGRTLKRWWTSRGSSASDVSSQVKAYRPHVICCESTPAPEWLGFESPPPVRLGEEFLHILPSRVRGPQVHLLRRFNQAGQNVLQQGIGEGKLCVYQSEERLYLLRSICKGSRNTGL